MKPLKPEDKKKAIGLVVGCVLVFGFLGKNLMSIGGGTPPPPEKVVLGGGGSDPNSSQAAGTVVIPSGVPAAPPQPKEELIDPPVFLASETQNPFHSATGGSLFPEVGPAGLAQPIRPAVVPIRRGSKRKGSKGLIDPDGDQPILPPAGQGSEAVMRPDTDAMQVMGVATGPRSVAVIRVGAQDYVVGKGETFGHGLRLKEVSDTQVVIEHGSELHILRVGIHPPSPPPSSQAAPVNSPPLPAKTKSSGIS